MTCEPSPALAPRHFRNLHTDEGVFVPTSAELDGQRDLYRRADGAKNIFQQGQLAEQAGAAAFHDFLGGAAEVDVHGVVTKVLDHLRRFGHDSRIRAKKLRRDGMLVFLEVEIT